jgi:hypothetical protein
LWSVPHRKEVTHMRKGISLLLLLLALSATTLADSRARIVRLSYLEGDVELDRRDGHGFQRAFLNMPIIEGSRVWTRGDARAEIEFEDASTLRLAPNSIIEFQELALRGDGDRLTAIGVQEGTLYGNFKKRRQDDLRITYAQDQITLDKASRFRLELDKVEVKLAVFRGELALRRYNGERISVRKNETVSINFDDRDRYYLAKGIVEAPHDYWDRDREEELARYAAKQSYRSYPAVYAYGYPDLYAYGSFFSVSGFGWVWRPYHVSFGWSPFADGSWVWYPSTGYVWVSPYPWGWTPYRYGSWVFIRNHGWCWRGGNTYNTWYSITNVYNAPPNFRRPFRPSGGPGHTGAVINVGRGGSPTPIAPEERPVVTSSRPGGPDRRNSRDDLRSDVVRPSRDRRDRNGVITNETLGTSSSTTPAVNVPAVSGDRPVRAERDAVQPAIGGTGQDRAERPVRTRETHDPDYNAVDYRANDGLTIQGDSRARSPRAPNDVEVDARQRGDRLSRTPSDTTPSAPAATPSATPPMTRERAPGPVRDAAIDRSERPMRIERAAPSPSPRTSHAPAAPVSRPSTPPPAAVYSPPPPSAPPPSAPPSAGRERSERPR